MLVRSLPTVHWLLLAVLGQLSVRALLGGAALLIAPSGRIVGLSTGALVGTPFTDYLIPGTILLLAFGFGPIVVGVALYRRRSWAWLGSVAVGIMLLGWIAVEVELGFERPTFYVNLATAGAMLVLAIHPGVRQVA